MRSIFVGIVVVIAVGGVAASALAQSAPSTNVRELRDVRVEIELVHQRHELIKVDVGRHRVPMKGYVVELLDRDFDLVSVDGRNWRIAYDEVCALIDPVTGQPIAAVPQSSIRPFLTAAAVGGAIVVGIIVHALMQPMP